MDLLQALSNLNLPGWFIIIAASVFILKQVGLLDFVTSRFADVQEHKQSSENVAIDVLREIIRESIQEYSKEMRELDRSIYRLGRQIDNNTLANRHLAGIIDEKLSAIKKD